MTGIYFINVKKKKKTTNILYKWCIQVPTKNTILEFYSQLNYGLYLNQQLCEKLAIGATRQNVNANAKETIDRIKDFLNTNLTHFWAPLTHKKLTFEL